MWIYTIPAAVGFVLALPTFWYNKPPSPPSPTTESNPEPFLKGLKQVCVCVYVCVCVCVCCVCVCVYVCMYVCVIIRVRSNVFIYLLHTWACVHFPPPPPSPPSSSSGYDQSIFLGVDNCLVWRCWCVQ